VVFYCVIVGENEKVKYQSTNEERNNQEKVLSNIVFYKNQNASIEITQKWNRKVSGKQAKRKKKERRLKGKRKHSAGNNICSSSKRYILKKSRSRKLRVNFFLLKKNFSKIFDLFDVCKLSRIFKITNLVTTLPRNSNNHKILKTYNYIQYKLININITNSIRNNLVILKYKLESLLKIVISVKLIRKVTISTL